MFDEQYNDRIDSTYREQSKREVGKINAKNQNYKRFKLNYQKCKSGPKDDDLLGNVWVNILDSVESNGIALHRAWQLRTCGRQMDLSICDRVSDRLSSCPSSGRLPSTPEWAE